jgi:methylenetetrahydrofolate reductase (NADPH)
VWSMMGEVRRFSAFEEAGIRPKVAVTSRLSPLPGWKAEADPLVVQASYRPAVLAAWRDGIDFAGKVYAGVLVLPSEARTRKWSAEIPEIDAPE